MTVTILLVTYNRPTEIRRTVTALLSHLHYAGDLRWHIADDDSPPDYLPQLRRDFPALNFTCTVTPRQGWGANVNKALQHPQMSDLIFLCEDDYVAYRDLDLDYGAALLSSVPTLGLVRYDGLAGHVGLNLWLQEAATSMGRLDYLLLDRQQSTHLNVYSHRPHLRHRRFHDTYGLYPEHLPLGLTEDRYAHLIKDIAGPEICCLPDGVWQAFEHIGISRQGTVDDVLLVEQY